MTPPDRTVKVFVDGIELEPPPGTTAVPVLVSDELLKDAYDAGAELSGCGAKACFEEIESGPGVGFTTVTLISGNKAPH